MNADALRALYRPYSSAFTTMASRDWRAALGAFIADDVDLKICHPFGDTLGVVGLIGIYEHLTNAMPDAERRDMIVLAGTTPEGQDWIGVCGNYFGTFTAPFLDIPPSGHLAHMRYHEYFRVVDGKVVEIQAIWDIPELMMQADAWPMSPQLGRFMMTPAPMTQDGLTASGDGQDAIDHVIAMLTAMVRHPNEPAEAMELERFWHPNFNWYGPAGIGTARGISGFRHWHQIPFLQTMPDRGLDPEGLHSHWIGEGNYTCETGWPNMRLTITGDGWLGIAPAGQVITLRSLDFWRLEDGLIRENWVLVDLLDMYAQIGVDVLARMRMFNKARNTAPIAMTSGIPE